MPPRRLLVGVTDAQNSVLGEGFAHDLQANRQVVVVKAARHVQPANTLYPVSE